MLLAVLALLAAQSSPEIALREQVRLHPAAFDSNHRLAEFYAHNGRLHDAIPYFEKARGADPAHYINGYDLALAYLETGAIEKARRQVADLLRRGDRAELHNLAGAVEEKSGNLEAAGKEYQRAATLDPSEKNVFDLANFLVGHHAAADALTIFRYGAEKYPRSARLRVGLGIAYYSVGKYDDAVESLCQGVDLDPDDPRPMYFLGTMYDVSPAMAEAVTARLAHFVEVYPNSANANYYYALSLWKRTLSPGGKRDLSRVEQLLRKAVKLNPNLHEAWFQLGVLYQDQDKLPEAIREFERAVRLKADAAQYHYRLGQAYLAAGRRGEADDQFRLYRGLHRREP